MANLSFVSTNQLCTKPLSIFNYYFYYFRRLLWRVIIAVITLLLYLWHVIIASYNRSKHSSSPFTPLVTLSPTVSQLNLSLRARQLPTGYCARGLLARHITQIRARARSHHRWSVNGAGLLTCDESVVGFLIAGWSSVWSDQLASLPRRSNSSMGEIIEFLRVFSTISGP